MYSTSLRLASRISNNLRAGRPVREFAGLQDAELILLSVPGEQAGPLMDFDALDWTGKTVLVCDSAADLDLIEALRTHGIPQAALNPVPGFSDLFSVTGDRTAVREAKSLVKSLQATAIEVPVGRLNLFGAALTLSTSLFTPMLDIAADCLRQSGLTPMEAAKWTDTLFQQTIRGYRHAGRKSWSGPVASADSKSLKAQEDALHTLSPLAGGLFRDAVRYSFDLYQTFPELTRYNKERWRNFRRLHRNSS